MDFGCGSKPYFTLFGHCRTYTGIDVEISGHPHRNEKIDVYYDGRKIPFGNDHFEGVFCSEVFEHVFNLDEILPEIRRVMKPGAKMLVTCPFVWPEHETPYDFARYSSYGIRNILERHGFAILQQEKTGHFPEVVLQQLIFYISCFIPKKPVFIYYILHQLLILPFILLGELINLVLPKRMKRTDLFHNNVLLVEKTASAAL
jgi:SAM-dependent methyltransferase